jgi:hypothetical protein
MGAILEKQGTHPATQLPERNLESLKTGVEVAWFTSLHFQKFARFIYNHVNPFPVIKACFAMTG